MFFSVKRESSVDILNDNKGITDKLKSFIRRRPQRELLEKKGIYKGKSSIRKITF